MLFQFHIIKNNFSRVEYAPPNFLQVLYFEFRPSKTNHHLRCSDVANLKKGCRNFTKTLKMKKILALGASNSRNSINKQFAAFASHQISNTSAKIIDLNDFEMPIYSIDREKENGIPEAAQRFKELIEEHDGIIISFAEHNSNFSAAFKNIADWASRLEGKTWAGKPMFLLATSPGRRGGASVLDIATKLIPHSGGRVVASFSLPLFKENFSTENGILHESLKSDFGKKAELFANEVRTVGAAA